MPWHHFNSPIAQWAVMPSFLIGEWLFIVATGLAFLHAWSQPGEARRRHVFAWVGALLAGTGNDAIFMALPLVDNFWQAQATIMLTERMPLYIPCVYVWFMYVPTVAVWRLGLPRWAAAPLSGLLAILIYAPYDIIGAKFLWWTWHDTDGPIRQRLLGVPVGSTMWVITFVAAFAFIVGWAVERDPSLDRRSIAKALPLVAFGSTPVMVVQMTLLQQIDGGTPGPIGLGVVVVLYLAVAAAGWRRRELHPTAHGRRLFGVVGVYYATLVGILLLFDPATHRSTSVHQTVGECYVEATDIAGLTRFEFLCPTDFDEDFSFACADVPPDGTRWYTVCGQPHRSRGTWIAVTALISLLGAAAFFRLLASSSMGDPDGPIDA